jgi:hypothetical protein
MRPQPCARISSTAAAVVWKAELRLIAMIWSHFSDGKLLDRRDVLDAGVVHQDVDAAHRRLRLLDQRAAVRALRHVGGDIDRPHVVFLRDAAGDRMVLVAVGERVQHHVRAQPRQFLGDPEADARIGAGDDGGLSRYRHVSSLGSVRFGADHTCCGCERTGGSDPAGARATKKRRPHKEGVKSLRQVSYRQETYRAVQTLYEIKDLTASQDL